SRFGNSPASLSNTSEGSAQSSPMTATRGRFLRAPKPGILRAMKLWGVSVAAGEGTSLGRKIVRCGRTSCLSLPVRKWYCASLMLGAVGSNSLGLQRTISVPRNRKEPEPCDGAQEAALTQQTAASDSGPYKQRAGAQCCTRSTGTVELMRQARRASTAGGARGVRASRLTESARARFAIGGAPADGARQRGQSSRGPLWCYHPGDRRSQV